MEGDEAAVTFTVSARLSSREQPQLDASVAETDRTDDYAAEPARDDEGNLPAWQFRLAAARHYRSVYRFAAALLGDRHEAEDVTQETFLRYWQHARAVSRPKEWLLAVARNLSLDRLRRARPTVDIDSAALEHVRDERDPEWHLWQRELAARLRDGIAALAEPQRSLVILFDVHGLSGATCARILDLNVNQVKVYLHRARRRLRLKLEGSS
jgi:RNA polymerase sigma-70 factor (ECF subfamily)